MADFKLDRQGIGQILKSSEVAAAVAAAGAAVAANLPADLDVYIDPYVSDRAGVTLVISSGRNVAGREAKSGDISRAVIAAGLDYKGKL